ncbi:unnamed protein product [Caenorhabditis auriculariae]|uniref:Uncharacterized protein n=1 Tax=Caenorhabditis auriculariae TaxID=2777116 RepID=A0A8S1GT60_9PELO|nr:unnamed protein product [Caenorhabditis auriculariae]
MSGSPTPPIHPRLSSACSIVYLSQTENFESRAVAQQAVCLSTVQRVISSIPVAIQPRGLRSFDSGISNKVGYVTRVNPLIITDIRIGPCLDLGPLKRSEEEEES